MQLTVLAVTFLASVATARHFEIYPEVNFGGQAWAEDRNDDAACWNLNGGGDHAQSVKGDGGCTTFYRERDCKGSNWRQVGSAFTVPDFLKNHIWSFRNQC